MTRADVFGVIVCLVGAIVLLSRVDTKRGGRDK